MQDIRNNEMFNFEKIFENKQFLKQLKGIIDERLDERYRIESSQTIDNSIIQQQIFWQMQNVQKQTQGSIKSNRQSELLNDFLSEEVENKKDLKNEIEATQINHKSNDDSISQFIDGYKKEQFQENNNNITEDLSRLSQQEQKEIQQKLEEMNKKKGQIISQLNNALLGISQFNVDKQFIKIVDQIENRLGRCEKVCLEKLVQVNNNSQLNNQNLESISKNFNTIHTEVKKINSFLDVIQEEQLHLKLKIEESHQTTKKGHHSRVKSVSNQHHFMNGQGGGVDIFPEELLNEIQQLRIDVDMREEQIKHLEFKIIKVQQDCFKLEEEIEERFKIFEEKVINVWQSIAFMTENITEINKKLEKKKSFF